MKKNIVFVSIFIVAIIAIVICSVFLNIFKSPTTPKISSEGTISGVKYQIYEDFRQGRYDYTKRGYYVDTFNMPNAPWLYIITMGEKNTGGYQIYITDLKIDNDRNVEVTVAEIEPPKNATVTQAFTYPACCLELSEYAKTIVIKNTKGKVFKQLN